MTDYGPRVRPTDLAVGNCDLPEPARPVDHLLANRVRQLAADRLAACLTETPVTDPRARREFARSVVSEVLVEHARARILAGRTPLSDDAESDLAETVMDSLFGMGRLQPLIDNSNVENIEVNGHDNVWLCFADGTERRADPVANSDEELVELVANLVARTGNSERTFSTANPTVHLRLDDGSRLAAMAWITPRPQVVIRRHRVREVTLQQLVDNGSLSVAAAEFLAAAIRAGKNLIVTGLQNSGKTTLLRALAAEFPPTERFATIEKEYELHLHELPRHPRVVAMEARIGSSERDAGGRAAGEITLSQLVVDALRMNVRRIIVGEVRGGEVVPMLNAMATGDGSMCTLHVRTPGKAIDRIVNLCLENGTAMTDAFAYRAAVAGIDLIVHLTMRHTAQGRARFVSEILEIDGISDNGRPVTTRVFAPGPDGRALPAHHPACLSDLVAAGFDATLLDRAPLREVFG